MDIEEKERDFLIGIYKKIIEKLHENPKYPYIFNDLNPILWRRKMTHEKITTCINIVLDGVTSYKPIQIIDMSCVKEFFNSIDYANMTYEEYLYYIKIIKRLERYITYKIPHVGFFNPFYFRADILFMPTADYQFHFSIDKKYILEAFYHAIDSSNDHSAKLSIIPLIKSMEYMNFPKPLIEWMIMNKNTRRHFYVGYIGDHLYYDTNPEETIKRLTDDHDDEIQKISFIIRGKIFENYVDVCYKFNSKHPKELHIERIKINGVLKKSFRYITWWRQRFIFHLENYIENPELPYTETNSEEGKEWFSPTDIEKTST
jgi:hypothetical protein